MKVQIDIYSNPEDQDHVVRYTVDGVGSAAIYAPQADDMIDYLHDAKMLQQMIEAAYKAGKEGSPLETSLNNIAVK